MGFRLLDCVVLSKDLPDHGLRRGNLGTVVETLEADALEVEFLNAAGDTIAVVSLDARDVRRVTPKDVVAARSS